MRVPVRALFGFAGIPSDRTSASRWLTARGIPISIMNSDGRRPEAVDLSDLPDEVRRAVIDHYIAASGLPAGEYDDDAHDTLAAATPAMRDEAVRKASIARVLVTMGKALPWSKRVEIVQSRFGSKGASKLSLIRLLKEVEGVDPINFAPALLADYCRNGAPVAEISDAAWSYFMTTIRDAGEQFPIIQAWRDVRDVAKRQGWTWPKYVTIWRRWTALPDAQRLEARHGREAAVKAIGQPILRDKTTIAPLKIVSLDGRTQDFWLDFGDGKPVRPVMITLVDVASNFILGYELTKSENAVATARIIRNVCQTYGIFDRLYTDNGHAPTACLTGGGNQHLMAVLGNIDAYQNASIRSIINLGHSQSPLWCGSQNHHRDLNPVMATCCAIWGLRRRP